MTEFNPWQRFSLFRRNRPTTDQLVQVAIGILSPLAMLLLGEGDPRGFLVGLASQPFWIYATVKAGQRGMFAISLLYLVIWIRGIAIHFPELFG